MIQPLTCGAEKLRQRSVPEIMQLIIPNTLNQCHILSGPISVSTYDAKFLATLYYRPSQYSLPLTLHKYYNVASTIQSTLGLVQHHGKLFFDLLYATMKSFFEVWHYFGEKKSQEIIGWVRQRLNAVFRKKLLVQWLRNGQALWSCKIQPFSASWESHTVNAYPLLLSSHCLVFLTSTFTILLYLLLTFIKKLITIRYLECTSHIFTTPQQNFH